MNISKRLQIRMTLPWVQAIRLEAKERKITQAALIRLAVLRIMPAERRQALRTAIQRPGRPNVYLSYLRQRRRGGRRQTNDT